MDNQVCKFNACGRPIRSNGLCQAHYMQQWKGQELRPIRTPETQVAGKPCLGPECSNPARFKNQLCSTHNSQMRRSGELWVTGSRRKPPKPYRKARPEYGGPCPASGCDERVYKGRRYCSKHDQLNRHMSSRYGITLDERQAKLEAQGGVCAICGKDIRDQPHVDHDHATGAVRDLLCGVCNRGLGMFQDSPDLLRQAATYLVRHREG